MKRQALISILVAMVLSSAVHAGEARRATVPDIIQSEVASTPAWVAASVALADDGTLRGDLFAEATRRSIARYLKSNEGRAECATTLGRVADQAASTRSASDLITNARSLFSGTVLDAREGFLFGSPGTLVAVEVEEWVKGGVQAPVFLFHPYARIRTPHGVICAVPVAAAPAPSNGDRVMIFAYTHPVGLGAAIFRIEAARQMVLRGRAAEHTPEAIRRELGNSREWRDLVEFVRTHPGVKAPSREPEVR
ncbi:MAG TPA: hypothetical protein VGF48_26620 [Thermoanaerobaculia bacterium]|jgi:hypothetical protein